MSRSNVLGTVLVLLAAVAGCRTTEGSATREITLSRGSTLEVAVDTEGHVRVTAVVPAGAPGEGTYTSTNPALQEDATDAKNALNEPGGVTISVDPNGRLVGFGRISSR